MHFNEKGSGQPSRQTGPFAQEFKEGVKKDVKPDSQREHVSHDSQKESPQSSGYPAGFPYIESLKAVGESLLMFSCPFFFSLSLVSKTLGMREYILCVLQFLPMALIFSILKNSWILILYPPNTQIQNSHNISAQSYTDRGIKARLSRFWTTMYPTLLHFIIVILGLIVVLSVLPYLVALAANFNPEAISISFPAWFLAFVCIIQPTLASILRIGYRYPPLALPIFAILCMTPYIASALLPAYITARYSCIDLLFIGVAFGIWNMSTELICIFSKAGPRQSSDAFFNTSPSYYPANMKEPISASYYYTMGVAEQVNAVHDACYRFLERFKYNDKEFTRLLYLIVMSLIGAAAFINVFNWWFLLGFIGIMATLYKSFEVLDFESGEHRPVVSKLITLNFLGMGLLAVLAFIGKM